MSARTSRRPGAWLVTSVTAALALGTVGAAGTAAAADDPGGTAQPAPTAPPRTLAKNTKLLGGLGTLSGTRSVFVQLAGSGAADAAASASGTAAKRKAVKDRRAAVGRTADSVLSEARRTDKRATALYEVSNAVPGVALRADADTLVKLADRADVVAIMPIIPKKPANAGADAFTRALATWQNLGETGEGVTIGVIDTGIDYTHAGFGGPGTVAAYDTALAASADAWTPTAKVIGGYDFVGNNYNADPDADDYQPVPHPDPNPLDCQGHGSHVAGSAAGFGVLADGSTFTGDYGTLTAEGLLDMRVGPGVAPHASLYALKVFGCTGSTNEVIAALDRALDPNGDGDLSDKLDVVNLSLGSDYGVADDPENLVIDKLATHGVLPVLSAGNNGDLTDTGGSPGNAVRGLAVASSVDPYQLRDGLKVEAPADLAGILPGQFSISYDWSAAPVTGDVATIDGSNSDGCAALSAAEAARVSGRVAWLTWDDNDATRRCGSAARANNVTAAGAIGAIFTSDLDVFAAGISGNDDIPIIQLPATQTARLAAAAAAGTLRVTFDGALAGSIKDITDEVGDTVSSFSSRGVHGSIGVVKPDVAAPGDTISSVAVGTGTGAATNNGTSMSAPHVAGIAALVRATHPSWDVERVKAAIMNTATHDVRTDDGVAYGPARVGAGRVDALSAVTTDLIAYAEAGSGAISASFGVVAAPISRGTVTERRTVTVRNTGRTTQHVRVSYSPATEQPGVSYRVSPARVKVRAGSTAKVTVTMVVKPSALRRTIDPTMAATQVNPYTGADEARQFLADASGRLVLTARDHELRVPVYGAAKPTSQTKASISKHRTSSPAIELRGKGVEQGSGSSAYTSYASVLTLGETSARLPRCSADVTTQCVSIASERAGDLRYVGAGSVAGEGGYADGLMWFGIATWGDWATIGNTTIPYVDMDVDGDGRADYEVFVQNISGTDLLEALLVDLSTGALVSIVPANFASGDVDTNVFDTNVLLIPVDPAAIGMTSAATSFPVTYQVGMFSAYTNEDVDTSGALSFDVADPDIVIGSPLYVDARGTIGYTLGSSAAQGATALVIHLHGDEGKRAEVLTLPSASSPTKPPKGKKHHKERDHIKRGKHARSFVG
ncbi:S8 family serine peptidase [Sanguibacter sp. A247]|uniref:S8 family serine peptidase n=1 Tax=unclassified Sanguibacter TaxID=2645534 RepID=UPI003FD6FB2D